MLAWCVPQPETRWNSLAAWQKFERERLEEIQEEWHTLDGAIDVLRDQRRLEIQKRDFSLATVE